MNILNQLKGFFSGTQFSAKLLWMIAFFTLPVAAPTYMLVVDIGEQVTFAQSELQGADYFHAIRQLYEPMVEHRRLVAEASLSGAAGRANLKGPQGRIDEALKAIQAAESRIGTNPHTAEALATVLREWTALKTRVESPIPQDKTEEIFTQHTVLLTHISELMTEAADASKLTLDPEYGSYSIQLWLQQVMDHARYIGETQYSGYQALAKGKVTPDDRDFYIASMTRLEKNEQDLASGMEDIQKEAKQTASLIEGLYRDMGDKREDFLRCLAADVIKSPTPRMTREQITREGNAAIEAGFRLYDASEPQLYLMLKERIAHLRSRIAYSMASIAIGYAAVMGLVLFIIRGITRQLTAIRTLFIKIKAGDFTARADVLSRDELGQMAVLLNDNILPLVQSQEERNIIQRSIQKLLDEVSGLAEGDLTKEAEVTADITGALADSFNYMIDQLRLIIGNVQDVTEQVSTSASQITATATHLAEGGEHQADQIVGTSAAIDEMAASIQQVSETANTSASVAQQALASAQQGNEAVQNTIQGMNRIRDQVQETAKRIKRLGESSQEIGQIIQLIDDIADRTSILALNASIQAAAAGEAGRGFAVVAAEVERLAERSTDATKKIATLVKTIQGETNEAVAAMEKGIHEVVDGSKLANQAGKALGEIENVSQKLAQLIGSISEAANQQARSSDALSKSMAEISQITQATAAGTKQAAQSVEHLASLADELRSSVSTFKLPGQKQVHQNGSHGNPSRGKPLKV